MTDPGTDPAPAPAELDPEDPPRDEREDSDPWTGYERYEDLGDVQRRGEP